MAEGRYREKYIGGSAAPKRYEEVPLRMPERKRNIEVERRNREEQRVIAENQRNARKIGGLFTFFIACAMVAMLFTCVKFIANKNKKYENDAELARLQSEYTALKEQNDLKKLAIDTGIDYNNIYNRAVGELGMVYATDEQLIRYDRGESEYVMQFGEMPK